MDPAGETQEDEMQLWELFARESIRETIAKYAYAGDRLLVEQMAQTFCEDGVLETGRDSGVWVGRDAILERLGGGRGTTSEQARAAARAVRTSRGPVIRRHVLTNIHFEELTPDQATVSSYFTVFTNDGLDHFGRYRDVLVPVGDSWLLKHRIVARDWQQNDRESAR
jgi:hypothetical protein